MQAGTHVCLRQVRADAIYAAIADHGVDHMCGAPIVLNMIANAPEDEKRAFDHTVKVMTAGLTAAAIYFAEDGRGRV